MANRRNSNSSPEDNSTDNLIPLEELKNNITYATLREIYENTGSGHTFPLPYGYFHPVEGGYKLLRTVTFRDDFGSGKDESIAMAWQRKGRDNAKKMVKTIANFLMGLPPNSSMYNANPIVESIGGIPIHELRGKLSTEKFFEKFNVGDIVAMLLYLRKFPRKGGAEYAIEMEQCPFLRGAGDCNYERKISLLSPDGYLDIEVPFIDPFKTEETHPTISSIPRYLLKLPEGVKDPAGRVEGEDIRTINELHLRPLELGDYKKMADDNTIAKTLDCLVVSIPQSRQSIEGWMDGMQALYDRAWTDDIEALNKAVQMMDFSTDATFEHPCHCGEKQMEFSALWQMPFYHLWRSFKTEAQRKEESQHGDKKKRKKGFASV